MSVCCLEMHWSPQDRLWIHSEPDQDEKFIEHDWENLQVNWKYGMKMEDFNSNQALSMVVTWCSTLLQASVCRLWLIASVKDIKTVEIYD